MRARTVLTGFVLLCSVQARAEGVASALHMAAEYASYCGDFVALDLAKADELAALYKVTPPSITMSQNESMAAMAQPAPSVTAPPPIEETCAAGLELYGPEGSAYPGLLIEKAR
jgi:hypothetical protein